MENEKHFYPILESKENEPKAHQVDFDDNHFGEIEAPIDTLTLVGKLNTWWDKICTENGLNPDDEKIFNFGYYVIELGKNALEYADGGEIKVIFEGQRITIMVTDQGQGFEDLNDINYSTSLGHGLSEVRKYADEFTIETNGKKYTKVKGKRKLVETQESDIKQGSKITFIKNFE